MYLEGVYSIFCNKWKRDAVAKSHLPLHRFSMVKNKEQFYKG